MKLIKSLHVNGGTTFNGNVTINSSTTTSSFLSISSQTGNSIAIGRGAVANGGNSIAIGNVALINGFTNSVAIGAGARCTANNQIVLGTARETVSIPGLITATGLITANGGIKLLNTQIIKGIVRGYHAGGGTGSVSFGFTFSSTPSVVASIISGSTNQVFSITVNSITTTGFSYSKTFTYTTSANGGGVGEDFNWIAIGS